MAETFVIELHYKGVPVSVPGELRVYGYTYKIALELDGVEVMFEPDEERNFRAIVPEGTRLDRQLVEIAASKLEETFR